MEQRPLKREISETIDIGRDPLLFPSWSAYGWPGKDV